MDWQDTVESRILSLLPEIAGEQPCSVQIRRSVVRGGLEAGAVGRFAVRYLSRGRRRALNVIAKQLDGRSVREAGIYESLLPQVGADYAPALFAVERHAGDHCTLLLEDIPRKPTWPWRETSASRAVLQSLARFHISGVRARTGAASEWDYEGELCKSALATLDLLDELRSHPSFGPAARRGLRPLRRFTSNLESLRGELLNASPFHACFIHGDVHPGNVLMRRRAAATAPVFIDWARARDGSPLEDVSSWLQSLGLWEPDARRRHDTLLRCYLCARGHDSHLATGLRDAYWVAGACNALAGALRYYCVQLKQARSPEARAQAAYLAQQWLRVLARADAATS